MHSCGVKKSTQLQGLASSLFLTCIKLLGFNRQDRDSITPNGQYLSSSINWQCSLMANIGSFLQADGELEPRSPIAVTRTIR